MTTASTTEPAATPHRLGLVVARTDGWPVVAGLARAALQRGVAVRIFAMDLAVAAEQLATHSAIIRLLLDDGAHVAFCATSLDDHHSTAPLGVELGSQLDHARLLQWATRVVALT